MTMETQFAVAPLLTVDLADPAVVTSGIDNTSFRFSDPRLVSVLVAADGGNSAADWVAVIGSTLNVDADAAHSIFERLVATGVVRQQSRSTIDADIQQWSDSGWGPALTFHLTTRNLTFADVEPGAERPYGGLVDAGPPPEWFTEHDEPLDRIPLPSPAPLDSAEPFASMILRRRTNRPWTNKPIPFDELIWLLAVTNRKTVEARWRATAHYQDDPSVLLDVPFGPFESYLVVNSVDHLPAGLFHVNLAGQSLDLLRGGSLIRELMAVCGNQPTLHGCQFAVLIFAEWRRQQFTYRHPRGYRNLFVSAGEFAQAYVTAATALTYSTFLTPATLDDLAAELLPASRFESNLLYIIGIG
jgi:nitroreductase